MWVRGRSPLSSPSLCGLCENPQSLIFGDSQAGSQGVNNHAPGWAGAVGNSVKVAQEMRLRNLFCEGALTHLAGSRLVDKGHSTALPAG